MKWSGRRTDQVEDALESGARVCGDEAEVRICEATLSRIEEECHSTVRGLRAGEPVSAAKEAAACGTSIARLRRLLITSVHRRGKPPNPNRLHWHG